MIHSPEQTALILAAIQSIMLGNNGYADIGTNEDVAEAVKSAGFVVIRTTDIAGRPVFRGFTQAAQKALAASPHGVSTYRPLSSRLDTAYGNADGPDYEAAILARNADHLFA